MSSPTPSRSVFDAERRYLLLVVAYVVIFGSLLVATGGYPYVFDNNESYSSLWHAHSLYANGIAQTKGLTDEVFAHHAAASPYVHTHQGNFPRLFTFALYVLGLRSVESQMWVTVFTVGLAGFFLAYRYLRLVSNELFATLACLVLMTDYLLFVEYHANLYHVWHLFFLFSSLLCMHGLGGARRRRWVLLSFLNFACLFYWEIVFTAFVSSLCALYVLVLYRRRWRVVLGAWACIAAGAAAAGALLLTQLTAYMGWTNVLRDIHFTLTARNSAADSELLRQIVSFYREHHIIFWYNFQDTTGLRSAQGFVDAFFGGHLTYYTPELAAAMLILAVGWLLGLPRGTGPVRSRNLVVGVGAAPPTRGERAPATRQLTLAWQADSAIRFLAVLLAFGWILTAIWAAFEPWQPAPTTALWVAAALSAVLHGRAWTGYWWGWRRLGVPRLLLGLGYAAAARAFLHLQSGLYDQAFRDLWHDATGDDGTGWIPVLLVFGAAAAGLSLILLGNRVVLGRSGRATGRGLVPLLFGSVAAYAGVYAIFTGYVHSGYLVRHVPLFVFLTDLLLALDAYLLVKLVARGARRGRALLSAARTVLAARSDHERELALDHLGLLLLTSPLLPAAALLVLGAGCWVNLQARYLALAPPDSYAFLQRLNQPPFRGASVVTNVYPAPMAWKMGAWGYADSSVFSGMLKLTAHGFETGHDLKYLWLADRDTNPAYLRPDFALFVVQPVNLTEALQRLLDRRGAGPDGKPPVLSSGLIRRAREDFQPFLRDQLVATDNRHFGIIKFDWDLPPYLEPVDHDLFSSVSALSLRQKLAISAASQDLRRLWRIGLDPLPAVDGSDVTLVEATVDGRPVFTAATLAAAGWRREPGPAGASTAPCNGADGRPISTLAVGDQVRLVLRTTPLSGSVRIIVNDTAQVLNLRTAQVGERVAAVSIALPYGRQTSIPNFAAGLYVRTFLHHTAAGSMADIEYQYAQQDGQRDAATTVRLYREEDATHWQIVDALTFLGPQAVPVRLAEFRRRNPDTEREYERVATQGDRRSYIQWLAGFLAATPAARNRPGVVAEAMGPPPAVADGVTRRRIPLPEITSGRLQVSVTPATWTKSGPEYFGLPFSARQIAALEDAGPLTLETVPAEISDTTALLYGRLRLRLRFPANAVPQAEPIVSTGVEEAGDFVYAIYVDSRHIRLGFDHWFEGGPLTKPIAIDYGAEHELEISLGSLFPPADDPVFAGMPAPQVAAIKNTVLVKLDGRAVIDAPADCYESNPLQVTVGRNTIKGTTSNPRFTGEILASERVWPEIK